MRECRLEKVWAAAAVVGAALAVGVIACSSSGGGSTPSGPSAAGNGQVSGTLTQDPDMNVAGHGRPGVFASLVARLVSLVGAAEAALPGKPVSGVTIQLQCNGAIVGTTTTTRGGRFEFEGVPVGTCRLFVILNGVSIPVATDIVIGTQPVEVEGRLRLAGGQLRVRRLRVESTIDDDDGHGHRRHHEEEHDADMG